MNSIGIIQNLSGFFEPNGTELVETTKISDVTQLTITSI